MRWLSFLNRKSSRKGTTMTTNETPATSAHPDGPHVVCVYLSRSGMECAEMIKELFEDFYSSLACNAVVEHEVKPNGELAIWATTPGHPLERFPEVILQGAHWEGISVRRGREGDPERAEIIVFSKANCQLKLNDETA